MIEPDIDENRLLQKLRNFQIVKEKDITQIKNRYPFFRKHTLFFLDYMTIRDLLELGGYQSDAVLFAVLMVMFDILQEGSLCLEINIKELSDRLYIFMEKEKAEDIADKFLSGLSKNRYKRLIATDENDYLPLILDERRGKRLLYFQKFYVYENRLKERLKTLLQAEPSFKISDNQVERFLDEIFSDQLSIRSAKGDKAIEKDPYQLDAIRLTFNSQFSIISGGPGTGKTSLIVNILRCFIRAGIDSSRIFLGAPTGRAAQRITEAIQYNIGTIQTPSLEDKRLLKLNGNTLHKILKYRSHKHDFYFNETNPIPASLIIVDEVSMVDLVMMEKFLRAVDSDRTKLIFAGDRDQLPSVEAGAVFAEMIQSAHPEAHIDKINDRYSAKKFENRFIVLKNTYRSGTNLFQMAKQINHGKFLRKTPSSFDSALDLKPDNWAFVQSAGVKKWKDHLRLWTDYYYLNPTNSDNKSFKDLILTAGEMDLGQSPDSDLKQDLLRRIFKTIEQAKILSLLRNGFYGCIGINRIIAQYLSFKIASGTAKNDIFPGALIIITRNDYSKELFNGDAGVVIKDVNGVYRAFFQRSGSYTGFAMESLPSWELAFAMTVHKSQGSEFNNVLVVLPDDENHKLLTREIIYTGITRAKKRVILYGAESALKIALQRKIKRQSGLSLPLCNQWEGGPEK